MEDKTNNGQELSKSDPAKVPDLNQSAPNGDNVAPSTSPTDSIAPPTQAPIANQIPPFDGKSTDKPGSGKTIATILLLIFFWPIGLILMFVWMKWPTWVKVVLTIFFVIGGFFILPLLATVVFVALNPAARIQEAECIASCENAFDVNVCVDSCIGSDFMMEDNAEFEVDSNL